jgi:hypothetical protein
MRPVTVRRPTSVAFMVEFGGVGLINQVVGVSSDLGWTAARTADGWGSPGNGAGVLPIIC